MIRVAVGLTDGRNARVRVAGVVDRAAVRHRQLVMRETQSVAWKTRQVSVNLATE